MNAEVGANARGASALRKSPAIIVAHSNVVKPAGGGVQICHREYAAALDAAGFELHDVLYEYDRSLLRSLRNRFVPVIAPEPPDASVGKRIETAIGKTNATHLFFELSIPPKTSRRIKSLFPALQQILLSHGTEGLDFVIGEEARRKPGGRPRIGADWALGKHFLDQAAARRSIDAALTLSPFEVQIETWLGTPKALWVPRTIMEKPLKTQPVHGRVGSVATLDHPPNLAGLTALFDVLAKIAPAHFRFRIVGRPQALGRELEARYPFVEYAGALSDAELRGEAASWCCFVNPIFVNAKGCSTKLAVALGWGLPVATTELGARGYLWDESILPLARNASELAVLVLERASVAEFEKHCAATRRLAEITPSIESVGSDIRRFLVNA
jgi:hypothetical protein